VGTEAEKLDHQRPCRGNLFKVVKQQQQLLVAQGVNQSCREGAVATLLDMQGAGDGRGHKSRIA